jgi:hypothetical protein
MLDSGVAEMLYCCLVSTKVWAQARAASVTCGRVSTDSPEKGLHRTALKS